MSRQMYSPPPAPSAPPPIHLRSFASNPDQEDADDDNQHLTKSEAISSLPFEIDYDGPAPISVYFRPRPLEAVVVGTSSSSSSSSSLNLHNVTAETTQVSMEATFRGRRVVSTPVQIPASYQGIIFSTSKPITNFNQTSSYGGRSARDKEANAKFRARRGSLSNGSKDYGVEPEEEGGSGLRRSPRKHRDVGSTAALLSAKVKRLKTKVAEKFSLDSDSEPENTEEKEEEVTEDKDETATEGNKMLIGSDISPVISATLDSVDGEAFKPSQAAITSNYAETALTSETSNGLATEVLAPGVLSAQPSLVPVDVPATPPSIREEASETHDDDDEKEKEKMQQQSQQVEDDFLSEPTAGEIQYLTPISRFHTIQIWNADYALDRSQDNFVKGLEEFLDIAEEIHAY